MKKLLFILFNLMVSGVFAQQPAYTDTLAAPVAAAIDTAMPAFEQPGLLPYNPDKKVSLRMEMGTTFGVASGGNNLFGMYVAPHISYKVSPRFRVNFGVRVQNSNFITYPGIYNPYYPEYTQTFDNNITQTFLYAEGQYLVHPNLMINAKVYKEISAFDEPKVNPRALDLNSSGMSVGFDYKVTDNFHFGAQIGYNKGRRPYDPLLLHNPDNFGPHPFGVPSMDPFDPWQ